MFRSLRTEAAARGPSAVLFLLLLVCYAYFFPRWADWNQNSRFALVQAIVEQGTFVIDDYYQQTGDYAVYQGHKYTDKAPGLSFLAVPAYAVFRGLVEVLPLDWAGLPAGNAALEATLQSEGTGLVDDKVRRAAALYFITFFTVSLPSAILWLLVYRFLAEIAVPGRIRLVVVLACGLGTVAFPYSAAFYSHQTAAFLLFLAFYLLFLIKRGRLARSYVWAVGGALGLAILTDFPSLLPSAVLLVYAAGVLPRRTSFLRIIGGAAPFALLLAFYNFACFGSPIASSYRYLALFPEQYTYGFLGFSLPTWTAFWGITFSPYRGLFFSSPILLLMLPGIWVALRSNRWRAELIVAVVVVVAYLGLISSYYDWKGGFAIAGPRNLIPMIPFAGVLAATGIETAWRSAFSRPLVVVALAWSLGVIFVQTAAAQAFAPIAIANPLFDFFLPALLSGDVNRNLGMVFHLPRWYSLLPLLVLIALVGSGLWRHERLAPHRPGEALAGGDPELRGTSI